MQLFAQQMRGLALSDLGDIQRTDFCSILQIQMGICLMPGVDVLCIFPSHVFEGLEN